MNRTISKRVRTDLCAVVFSAGLATASCTGTIGGPSENGSPGAGGSGYKSDNGKVVAPGGLVLPEKELAATVGIRRLSRAEYDATVRTLLEDASGIGSHLLPADTRNLFDSTFEQEKQISAKLVSDAQSIASGIAASFVNDKNRRDRIIGCKSTESGCLDKFVTRFGRLALRHPLSDEDKEGYLNIPVAAHATTDFYKSVELIVSAFLQDPEFLNRFEIGTPVQGVPDLVRLTGWELASRLSYLLWGDMPSPDLLDQVEQGRLSKPEEIAETVRLMLRDPRAQGQVALFHGLWLGYQGLSHELADAMRSETSALLAKVILEDHRPWQDIFRENQTLVSYKLAKNYGLPIPAGLTDASKPAWVTYPGTGVPRRGILSHGSLLSLGGKFGDTSPTVRGKEIRRRLFCTEIQLPSAAMLAKFKVDTSVPPSGTASLCKWDRYKANRDRDVSCAGCHNQIDLVGFGLENFDALGRYRTEQYWTKDAQKLPALTAAGTPGAERCAVKADGQVDGQAFTGPGGLADLVMGSGGLAGCALRQLYQFSTGVHDVGDADTKVIDRFKGHLGTGDFKLDEVLRDFVSSPAFGHRRMDMGN